MKAQWDANPQVHETYDHASLVGVDKSMFPVQYQNWWGDDDARRQFRSHWQYMKKRFSDKPKAKRKQRKKAKCGFCGSTAHNRRNCNKLKNFIYVLKETNKEYRSQFYDRFIDGMGLGAGALVRMMTPDGEKVGIVTDFPNDQIMFTNLKRNWSDYHTRALMGVLVESQTYSRNLGNGFLHIEEWTDVNTDDVWANMYSPWASFRDVISPAPRQPTKEWFLGQTPCFEWLVKKRSQHQILNELRHLIHHFYPRDNLRAKLGAKLYDRYYTK